MPSARVHCCNTLLYCRAQLDAMFYNTSWHTTPNSLYYIHTTPCSTLCRYGHPTATLRPPAATRGAPQSKSCKFLLPAATIHYTSLIPGSHLCSSILYIHSNYGIVPCNVHHNTVVHYNTVFQAIYENSEIQYEINIIQRTEYFKNG